MRGAALTAPRTHHLAAGPVRTSLARRLVRDFSAVLIISGLLLLADAGLTLVWQEPVTAVIAAIERSQVDQRLLSYRTDPLSAVELRTLTRLTNPQVKIAYLARRELRALQSGEALGRIVIPRLGASFVVVQGTDGPSLEGGPGHYPSTSLPGLGRTVAIAGHRTTYLAPFRHIDALAPGDRIVLQMPYGRFVYTVQFHRIVDPTAWWITRNVGYDRLVLSACNPLFSAAQRIVVFAALTGVRPGPR